VQSTGCNASDFKKASTVHSTSGPLRLSNTKAGDSPADQFHL
jgi:hypothetical protein